MDKIQTLLDAIKAFAWNDAMSPADMAEAHVVLKKAEDLIGAQKEKLRDELLDIAKKTESLKLEDGGFYITCQKSIASLPKADKLQDLMRTAKVKMSEVFDFKTTEEINPSKLARAISTGKLDATSVEVIKPITYRLKVNAPDEIVALLSDKDS